MFARHDLVWLTSRGWQRVRATVPPGALDRLDAWRDAGWPAVVRRAEIDLAPGEVAIGFALPPGADGKVRVGCRAELADIGRRTRALPLVGALDAAPAPWRDALAALERQAAEAGLGLAVYGSLALQALTGQSYLMPTSDIDLLLRPLNRAQLMTGLDLLARHGALLPLDGEVVFPDGRAVAWKELRAAFDGAPGTRVLAKSLERVGLVKPDELLATLEEDAWLD
ncbi:malonate decarboxylase holo-[acyl-carrier-protein] synthase [Pseudoduganella plicata]|uniref:Malonate decarboxylase holo-[acyl-carrier-protein] synthase n=1 Tax=Pseudoduganella plicata TaxID=321984 RepID=A0ABX5SCT3_9BURK|nr:malonate decarboxylase holo-[acyl-carrier-protein] synthase [Pseudoduganella plicata]QBQ37372.1 malonate decarboxylase holo-[acyl-carrier-protein] synthase [Pseudoduganella plicata]